MRRLSVCTDGSAHVFDLRLLDITTLGPDADIKCRYCGVTWDEIIEELARREFSEGVLEHEERDCGV